MEAIGRLAGGIAHDFNNLLTAILGFSELVFAELGPAHRSAADVREILKAAESAASLTRRILAFSRRQILQPHVLDLNDVLQRIESLVRRLIGEDVSLEIDTSQRPSPVYADAGQIEQIIMNLVVNARDAMPGGGHLRVATADVELDEEAAARHHGAAAGRYVMLAVSDTGVGMDEATQKHLFEPFFTTKGPGKGTGLGLATVYGIVTQSGGFISVASERGAGATFTVYLPAAPAASSDDAVSAPGGSPGGSETVLVVEDQEEVRTVITEVLRRYGYRVLEALDAAEAIAVSAQHPGPIDLLVTDVVMPQMDGHRLAHAVQSTRPDVRVLYVSGYSDEPIVQDRIVGAGLVLLQKPFTADVLARKVREVLDAAGQPGA
jgi:CheY-like chemotaxis protein